MTVRSRIGLDFDNTIVIYDDVFYRHAIEDFGMPTDISADKPSIRAYFWAYEGGRDHWVELQGIVYGTKMEEARIADDLDIFLHDARAQGLEFSIVSHKTLFPAKGPQVNLHDAAWQWLDHKGFFNPDTYGFSRRHVFFEPERSFKLERIAKEYCRVFIDDLPEVLEEENFPSETQRILYDPASQHAPIPGVLTCSSWMEIGKILHDHGLEHRSAS